MVVHYTGVGSRETPMEIQNLFTKLASILEEKNCILRSGGASGADMAFENGIKYRGNKEIYLPWPSFNGNKSTYTNPESWTNDILKSVMNRSHYNNLSDASRLLHLRNVHQVLGLRGHSYSKFLLCWTKDGKETGGTATAMKVAYIYDIPIFNFHEPKKALFNLKNFLIELKDHDK